MSAAIRTATGTAGITAISGRQQGAGELVVRARVVLLDDEPEFDLYEGRPATLTRVGWADHDVEYVLGDGRTFVADATSVTPRPRLRSARSLAWPRRAHPAQWRSLW